MEEINEKKKKIIKELYKIISVILAFVTASRSLVLECKPPVGRGVFRIPASAGGGDWLLYGLLVLGHYVSGAERSASTG